MVLGTFKLLRILVVETDYIFILFKASWDSISRFFLAAVILMLLQVHVLFVEVPQIVLIAWHAVGLKHGQALFANGSWHNLNFCHVELFHVNSLLFAFTSTLAVIVHATNILVHLGMAVGAIFLHSPSLLSFTWGFWQSCRPTFVWWLAKWVIVQVFRLARPHDSQPSNKFERSWLLIHQLG